MFKQRLIMTLILIPLVVALIIYANSWVFLGLMLLLILGMSYEWQQFFKLNEAYKPWFKTLLVFFGALLVAKFWTFFLYFDLAFWLLAIFIITQYPKHIQKWASSGFISTIGWLLLGVFGSILCEWQTSNEGIEFLFCVLFIVWAADIGAYLAGRKWGKHKMIPQVSPGKSWEGLFGGLGLALVVAYLEAIYMDPSSTLNWLIIALATAIISVFGDLWISVLKRHVNLKDTGHLIPGHGGLLDRLDSLLAALPVFYYGLQLFG